MLVRKLFLVAAVIGIITATGRTFAQDEPREITATGGAYAQDEPERPKSFVERLDAFGKKIVNGILPSKKQSSKPSERSEPSQVGENAESPQHGPPIVSRNDMPRDDSDDGRAGPRAGSILEKPQKPEKPKLGPTANDDPTLSMDQYLPKRKLPPARPKVAETPAQVTETRTQVSETPQPAPRSLHERMAAFRKSPFDSDDQSVPEAPIDVQPQKPAVGMTGRVEKAKKVEKVEKGATDADADSFYPENRPIEARHVVPAARAMAARPAEPIHEAENDRPAAAETRPKATNESLPLQPIYQARNSRPAAVEAKPKTADESLPPEPIYEARENRPAAAETQPKNADDSRLAENTTGAGMLFARKGPVLSVETMGPRTIVVGRESTYQVQIMNSGDVAAEDLVVHVTLPVWAEVARIEASLGEAKPPEAAPAGAIDWKVGHLDAKSRERLTIRIIPRQSRPFDLAVRWESKPVASRAMIEVQEPKLSLQLEGQHEVAYGKKQIYRLKLANTGSGNAENVTIVMTPIGAGENLPASYKVGLLAAGEEKSLDVELTAREGGSLSIRAEARGDGGLHAELLEKVLVRRGGLKIDITGPRVQFVGAVATYLIRVRNSGNAPARHVNFAVALPAGATYLSGIDGARFDSADNRLVWGVETLPTGSERRFAIKCRLATVGATPVRLSAVADDDLAAVAETSVRVETVATLTMDVKDPASPVPVGEEAVYEVRVRNRGTREAQNVEVYAYFSRGVEPTAVEGAPSRLIPGQVVFQPIASLAPGAEVVLKVHAKAEIAGNHIFRVEAKCRQLNARLVSEATNLYYSDSPGAAQTPQDRSATNLRPSDGGLRDTPPPIRSSLTPLLPRE
jgi:uncharacterized repeat protein (TIGR01451 family)